MKNKIFESKELSNASWLIGGRIGQMGISFVVGLWTARYLGPDNYGLINYASAYMAFFTSICTLGINSIIVKEFVDYQKQQGEIIGTTLLLRILASMFSVLMIIGIVTMIDKGEPLTISVTILVSLSLIFQCFDTFNYWFQFRYQSKIVSLVTLVAYIATSIYKVILLVSHKNVKWFAVATCIDYILIAILIYLAYKKCGGEKLRFSKRRATHLLDNSYHYILSGLMVSIYGQTDKLMLKQMLNQKEVGYYSVATAICTMWVFVLQAIIDSMYPTILKLYGKDEETFKRKNKQLYAIVFYVSSVVSLGIFFAGEYIIRVLYGKEYLSAVSPLKMVTWYTAFSYLGVARNAWIVCKNSQKYLKYIYFSAAVINVLLNLLFIPILGATGAALASLITQIFTSIILPFFYKDLRENSKLMLEAILLKGVF